MNPQNSLLPSARFPISNSPLVQKICQQYISGLAYTNYNPKHPVIIVVNYREMKRGDFNESRYEQHGVRKPVSALCLKLVSTY